MSNELSILLEKYFSGDISAQEEERLERLLRIEGNSEIFNQHIEVNFYLNKPLKFFNTETAFEDIQKHFNPDSENSIRDVDFSNKDDHSQRIHLEEEDGSKQVLKQRTSSINMKTKKKSFSINNLLYVAAASIALLIGLLTFTQFNSTDTLRFTTSTAIDSLLLEDGSKVVLSPNSEMEYPEKFEGSFREVRLIKGNAFFEVSKDPLHPFRIDQEELMTEVLGTSFNIRVTPLITEIDVKTGVVAVSKDHNQRIVVHKNEKVVFHRTENRLESVKESDFTNWHQSDVSLTNISLLQFSKFLEDRFGYKLTMKDTELHHERIVIHIADKDNIIDVINQVEYITNLQFKINTNEIRVHRD